MCRRDKPEASYSDHQQTGNDAAFISKTGCQPACGQGHQKITQVMRKLDPGRLRFSQMQFVLKVLVHHVDHSVADSPKQEKGTDQDEREHYVLAIGGNEESLFGGFHSGRSGSVNRKLKSCWRTAWYHPCGSVRWL